MHDTKARRFKVGWVVGAVLAALTIVEYFVAVGVEGNLVWLGLIGVAKAWLILKYFMHVGQVWGEEDHR